MKWIVGKKRYQVFYFIISILLNVLNITIFSIVLDLFFRVTYAKTSDWYLTVVNQMTDSDIFFQDKAELVFYTLAVVILILGVFCILILWMFQEQQFGMQESQVGIFYACGYSSGKLEKILLSDGLLDILLALFLSYGTFSITMLKICQNETLQAIYRIAGERKWIGLTSICLVGAIFALSLVFHIYVWINREKRKSIIGMIKEQGK